MARFASSFFWPRFIKRLLPSTLFGRSLLIIVLPVALMQVAVTWIFFDAHWQTVTSRAAGISIDNSRSAATSASGYWCVTSSSDTGTGAGGLVSSA